MRKSVNAVLAGAVVMALVVCARPVVAVPLLAVDFGTGENYLQSGFGEMVGVVSQSTANASFGSYTVDLEGQGFGICTGGHAAPVAQGVRALYRDYYFNDSDVPGVGVKLTIGGVTPNVPYNLTLWSYDGDQLFSSTDTVWGPLSGGNTSGGSGSVTNFYQPYPAILSDSSTTIQVSSTTSSLEIFGTTTSGFGGTRLNGFRLNDGMFDVLSVDLGRASPPPSPVQSGFQSMAGTFPMGSSSPPPAISSTFGSFTVTVSGDPYLGTDYTRVGFEDTAAAASGIDASIRPLFQDALINNLDLNNGAGLNLSIQGVVPNVKYAVKVWSYNADNAFYPTPTQFGPRSGSDTTGTTESIVQFAAPLPVSLNDYSTTIIVSSTTSTLDIHAASTQNQNGNAYGGTRFNAFQLSLAGDYNGDSRVDAADYVIWRKTDGTPAGYNVWRSNFGAVLGMGSGNLLGSAIPEPGTWMLTAIAFVAIITRRRG